MPQRLEYAIKNVKLLTEGGRAGVMEYSSIFDRIIQAFTNETLRSYTKEMGNYIEAPDNYLAWSKWRSEFGWTKKHFYPNCDEYIHHLYNWRDLLGNDTKAKLGVAFIFGLAKLDFGHNGRCPAIQIYGSAVGWPWILGASEYPDTHWGHEGFWIAFPKYLREIVEENPDKYGTPLTFSSFAMIHPCVSLELTKEGEVPYAKICLPLPIGWEGLFPNYVFIYPDKLGEIIEEE